jgi:hypothetical protein
MYMHPAAAQLYCTGHLDIVDGLRKPLGYRRVKERQKVSYESPQRSIRSAVPHVKMK